MKLAYRYWTKSKGVGGDIRNPEDFVVDEAVDKKFLRSYEMGKKGVRRVEGPYTLFLLKKRNMTTQKAINLAAKRMGVHLSSVGYAGLKDKFAVTTQYVTIKNPRVEALELNGLSLVKVGMTNKHVSVGNLEGNKFTITLHNCKTGRLYPAVRELAAGVPNYFGPQRFGKNSNNHVIGKLLIKRDFAKALEEINKIYGKHYAMLSDINKKTLKFFVNACQSWIFNETLNKYIDNNDRPLFSKIPIVGYDTKIKNDKMGKVIASILKKEKIKPGDFRIGEIAVACRGGERDAFIKVEVEIDSWQNSTATLRFALPKGSYATNVLREICKNEKKK